MGPDSPARKGSPVIRLHPKDPPLTTVEATRIGRITALAMVRGGVLTTAQQNTVDRILIRAWKRAEQEKRP